MQTLTDEELVAGLRAIANEMERRANTGLGKMCMEVAKAKQPAQIKEALQAPGFKIGAAVIAVEGISNCSDHPKYEGKRRCRSGCKGCEAVYAAKHPVVADGLAD